ncbi:MAG: SDR family NAD(P)-dependent oxidoreductase [Nitrospirales bacterium]
MILSSCNSTVLVAGGSGVIGQTICRCFGKQHWHVGIQYSQNEQSARQTVQEIHEFGGNATLHKGNVQDHAQTHAMIECFIKEHERLDVLVWAIGISESQLLMRTTPDSWNNHIATNLTGCFNLLNAVAPIFEQQQHGSVVMIGSLSGTQGTMGQAAYAASKAGLIGLMKSVAQEWAPWNIRVNAIFPGWHASPLSGTVFPTDTELSNHLLKKTPDTEDVAKGVYDLARMKSVSGQVWNLDSRILGMDIT